MTDAINAITKIMQSQIDFRKKYYAEPTSIMASKSIDSKAIEDQFSEKQIIKKGIGKTIRQYSTYS